MKRKIALSLLFVLACWMSIHAQNGMIVQHYTLEEGLPSNTVYCSLKDKDGFLWFGTWYGLCSFDGNKFMPFATRSRQQSDIALPDDQRPAVPPRKVISLVDDGDGHLWIRNVDNRLYLYNKHADIFHEVYDELKQISQNMQVIKIQQAGNGHVLLLTRNKNLYEATVEKNGKIVIERIFDGSLAIDPTTYRLQHNILGVNDRYLYWLGTDFKLDVVPLPKGNQYLSLIKPDKHYSYYYHTGNQIYLGNDEGEAYVIDSEKGSVSPVASQEIPVHIDKQQRQWLFNRITQTLVCQHPQTGLQQRFPVPQGEKITTGKFCDAGPNGLFILHDNGEVWRYDYQTGLMQNVADLRMFSSTAVNALRFFDLDLDSEGLLWMSSTTNGVYKVNFTPSHFTFFMPDLLSQEHETGDTQGIRALYQQKNGDLWICTRYGTLLCIDPKTQTVKPSPVKNIGNVYHIMEDHAGNLWFCTKGNGIIKAKSSSITHYVHNPDDRYSLNDDRVYYIFEDSRHRIWACTFGGGLNLIEERKGKTLFINRYNEFKDYPKYELYLNVRAIAEDADGRLWLGTTDGLMSFSGKFQKPQDIHFEIYREQQDAGTVDNDIFSLYKDSKGRIWLGMFGGGMNLLEG